MKKFLFAPGVLERHTRDEWRRSERRITRSDRLSRARTNPDSWSMYLLVCLCLVAYALLIGVVAGYLDWSLNWGAMR